jgi:hypothetical protein
MNDAADAARQEKHLKQIIHKWVLEREVEALQAADTALESLDKAIASSGWWLQR